MGMQNLEVYKEMLLTKLMAYGPKAIAALVVLFIGIRIINFIGKSVSKGMARSKMDVSLNSFLTSLLSWGLKIMLTISVASMVGIETTSFVAIIGAAGLAVGLALQGTLSNFAGGVLILIFKPFKVGDLIKSQGIFGRVEEIQIFITKVVTPENKTVILPNAKISGESLVNYTEKGELRVDLTIGVAYDSDLKKAKEVLLEAMLKNEKVLKSPAPMVAVSNLGDSSVDLAVRPWATPDEYWDVYFEVLEEGKQALDAANIVIPFPQRDVHMIQS